MKPYDQNIVTFEAMFVGYTEALNRLEAASGSRDPAATYVPLFEALNWAHALDERIAAHWVPNGKPLGLDWRERLPSAEIMAGVRFARNSLHHDWSEAVVLRDGGASFPLTFPVSFSSGLSDPSRGWEWIWRDIDELPPPSKKPHVDSAQIYREQLQGRTVKTTLDVLGGVFLTLQHMLEPHTLPRADWSDRPLVYHEEADGYYPFPLGRDQTRAYEVPCRPMTVSRHMSRPVWRRTSIEAIISRGATFATSRSCVMVADCVAEAS